jgi:hypothetical protein
MLMRKTKLLPLQHTCVRPRSMKFMMALERWSTLCYLWWSRPQLVNKNVFIRTIQDAGILYWR